MTINEIRELLPFYAANTLDESNRLAVEAALKNSPKLRDELEFWQHAKHAILLDAEFGAEGHLSSVEIVDYARGTQSDPSTRTRTENHLKSCDQCARVCDVIKSLQPEDSRLSYRHPAKSMWLFPKTRLAYFIPAIAVLLVAVIIWLKSEKNVQPQITHAPTEIKPTPEISTKQKRTVTFAFVYVDVSRNPSSRKNIIPSFLVASDVDSIRLEIPVQHSGIAEYYEAKIFLAATRSLILVDSLRVASRKAELDMLVWKTKATSFQLDASYLLKVKEVLRKEKRKYEREEYEYKFQLKRE